jgi:hypothetical protein
MKGMDIWQAYPIYPEDTDYNANVEVETRLS